MSCFMWQVASFIRGMIIILSFYRDKIWPRSSPWWKLFLVMIWPGGENKEGDEKRLCSMNSSRSANIIVFSSEYAYTMCIHMCQCFLHPSWIKNFLCIVRKCRNNCMHIGDVFFIWRYYIRFVRINIWMNFNWK